MAWVSCGLAMPCFDIHCQKDPMYGRAGQRVLICTCLKVCPPRHKSSWQGFVSMGLDCKTCANVMYSNIPHVLLCWTWPLIGLAACLPSTCFLPGACIVFVFKQKLLAWQMQLMCTGQAAGSGVSSPTSLTAGSQTMRVWTTRNVPSQWLWSNVPAGARYGMPDSQECHV